MQLVAWVLASIQAQLNSLCTSQAYDYPSTLALADQGFSAANNAVAPSHGRFLACQCAPARLLGLKTPESYMIKDTHMLSEASLQSFVQVLPLH